LQLNKTQARIIFEHYVVENEIQVALQTFLVGRCDIALCYWGKTQKSRLNAILYAIQSFVECNKKIRIERASLPKGLVGDVTEALRRTRFDMRQSAMVAIRAIRNKTGLHRVRSSVKLGNKVRRS